MTAACGRGLALAARPPRRPPLVLLAILLGSACASANPGVRPDPALGQKAPDTPLRDLAGRDATPVALRGKVVLLDLWATWCEPCRRELPLLDEIARRWHARGVEVVAVSIDSDLRNVMRFLSGRAWALRVVHDPEGAMAERLRPARLPTSYVVDRQGTIRHANHGFEIGDERKIETQIETLVRESS